MDYYLQEIWCLTPRLKCWFLREWTTPSEDYRLFQVVLYPLRLFLTSKLFWPNCWTCAPFLTSFLTCQTIGPEDTFWPIFWKYGNTPILVLQPLKDSVWLVDQVSGKSQTKDRCSYNWTETKLCNQNTHIEKIYTFQKLRSCTLQWHQIWNKFNTPWGKTKPSK